MARLPDEMVERIKREISVERLVEARGIQLKRVGKNLVGLCPFHKESKPSLTVTPSTNKWRCFGCGRGGTDSVLARDSTGHFEELTGRVKNKTAINLNREDVEDQP